MWTAQRIFELTVLAFFTLVCFASLVFQANRVRADRFFFEGDLYGAHVTDPYNYRYAYALGTALLSQNQAKNAIPYLEKTIRLHPNYPDAFNNLAVAYLKARRYRDGLNLIDSTFKKWPNHRAVAANKEMGDKMRKSLGIRPKEKVVDKSVKKGKR